MTGQQGRQQGTASEETQVAIANMISEVRLNDLVKQDWTKELSSAPTSVAILGECMLVASFKNAAEIQLDRPELRSKYLAPNLLEIAQVGSTTFIKAEVGMGQICASSLHVGGSGGTIDNIMKYLRKPKTSINKNLLGIQLNVLKKKSDTCAGEARKILADFEKWGTLVDNVWSALSDKSADSLREEREKAQELMDQMKKEADLVATQERSKANLELRRQKLAQATATRQKVDKQWEEYALFMTGVTIVNPLLGWSMFGLTTLGLWAAEYDFLNEEKLLEAQKRDLEQTLAEEKKLAMDLQKLRDNNTSLAEMKKTLSRAIGRLVNLTQCVRQMLLFFGKVTKMVDNIVEHQDDEFVSVLQIEDIPESEDDPEELQQATQHPAFRAKVHFATMQKVAEAYTDISNEHIIGGFDEIFQIGLSNICENDDEVDSKQAKLDALKRKSSQSVRATIQQRQKELYGSLQSIVEKSAQGILTKQIEN